MTKEQKARVAEGRIMGKLMGTGYSLKRGMNGIYWILNAKGDVVTVGTLAQIEARAESLAKEKNR